MKPISADSHVVEGPEVFTGLAARLLTRRPASWMWMVKSIVS